MCTDKPFWVHTMVECIGVAVSCKAAMIADLDTLAATIQADVVINGDALADIDGAMNDTVCGYVRIIADDDGAAWFGKQPCFGGDKAIIAYLNGFHCLQIVLPFILPLLCPLTLDRFQSGVKPRHIAQAQFVLGAVAITGDVGHGLQGLMPDK